MSSTILGLVFNSTINKGGQRLALLALANASNDDGLCVLSYEDIQKASGLSHGPAYSNVRKLCDAGLVSIVENLPNEIGGKGLNVWRIHNDKLLEFQHPTPEKEDIEDKISQFLAARGKTFGGKTAGRARRPESGGLDVLNQEGRRPESGKPQVALDVLNQEGRRPESGKRVEFESPIHSSFPSLSQNEGEREGGEISSREETNMASSAEPTAAALEVISDGLDWKTWGIPNLAYGRALAVLIDEAVATGLTLEEVRAHCQVVINRATQSAIGLLKIELAPDKLPMPRRKKPSEAPQKATETTTAPSAPRLTEEQEKVAQEAREAACKELGRPFDRWGPADQARMRSISQNMAREGATDGDIADALIAEITGAPSYSKPVAEPAEDVAAIAPDLEAVRAQALLSLTRAYGLDENGNPGVFDVSSPLDDDPASIAAVIQTSPLVQAV